MSINTSRPEVENMTPDEFILFLQDMLPYVNTGMIILNINILLMRLNFKITLSAYRKRPMESLILGLFLVFLSSWLSSSAQTRLSEINQGLVFLILFVGYILLASKRMKKKKRAT